MAAWIEASWHEERRGSVEDPEASRRRMLELMMRPFIASRNLHQLESESVDDRPSTLDLLPAINSGCPPARENVPGGCTHVELEPESPLPSGWEKCLDLKTGSIYYLNRTTGAATVMDPRKQLSSEDKACSRADVSSSSTTSDLTVEASNEDICKSRTKHHKTPLNINEKPPADENDFDFDLDLTLHVGLCSSPKGSTTIKDAGVAAVHPLNATATASGPAKLIGFANAIAPTASPSSSSSTSPLLSASLAFSQTILSSKELSKHSFLYEAALVKQDSNQGNAMRGGSVYAGSHHSFSEAWPMRAESEDVSAPAVSMVTVACANCMMFVMLSKSNPRCPRCGSNCPEQMMFPQPPLKRAKLGFSF